MTPFRCVKPSTAATKFKPRVRSLVTLLVTLGKTAPLTGQAKNCKPLNRRKSWWARRDSNPQPRDYESPALTVELQALQ